MPGRPAYWRNLGQNDIPDDSITGADLATLASSTQNDDFFYDAEPVTRYDTDGTFGTVTGAGGIIDYDTGTVAGNRAGIANTAQGAVDPTKDLVIKIRAGTATNAEQFTFIGAAEALPTAADPPVESDDAIYFTNKPAGTAVNWFAVTREDVSGSGGETAVDTGVAGDLSLHDFEISLVDSEAVFKIDGAEVARSRTNIPLVSLLPLVKIVTGNTTAKTVQIDSLNITNSRT